MTGTNGAAHIKPAELEAQSSPKAPDLPEKYLSWARYALAWVTRFILRSLLRPVYRWNRSGAGHDDYTAVIGVPWQMWELLDIPLMSLRRMNRPNCREVIAALDTTRPHFERRYGGDATRKLCERYADFGVRVLFYNRFQWLVTRLIDWNWVDCWLTWVIAIGGSKSRYILLHDFDAVVVNEAFVEDLFEVIRSARYLFAGAWPDNRLDYDHTPPLATVELMLDAAHVRSTYQPVHLFNRVRRYRGKRIECDILRDIQLDRGEETRILRQSSVSTVVHPHQMISEWHKLIRAKGVYAPNSDSTPLLHIPYFQLVVGDHGPLGEIVARLERNQPVVSVWGHPFDTAPLGEAGRAWIVEQIRTLQQFFNAEPGDLVERYCRAILNEKV